MDYNINVQVSTIETIIKYFRHHFRGKKTLTAEHGKEKIEYVKANPHNLK